MTRLLKQLSSLFGAAIATARDISRRRGAVPSLKACRLCSKLADPKMMPPYRSSAKSRNQDRGDRTQDRAAELFARSVRSARRFVSNAPGAATPDFGSTRGWPDPLEIIS